MFLLFLRKDITSVYTCQVLFGGLNLARKEKHNIVHVHPKIYAALKERLPKDFVGSFDVPSMNRYINEILWAFAMGRVTKRKSQGRIVMDASGYEGLEVERLDHDEEKTNPRRKRSA